MGLEVLKLRGVEHTTTDVGDSEAELLRGVRLERRRPKRQRLTVQGALIGLFRHGMDESVTGCGWNTFYADVAQANNKRDSSHWFQQSGVGFAGCRQFITLNHWGEWTRQDGQVWEFDEQNRGTAEEETERKKENKEKDLQGGRNKIPSPDVQISVSR